MKRKVLACLGTLAVACGVASGAGTGSASAPGLAAASAAPSTASAAPSTVTATPYYSPNWGGYLAVAPAGQHIESVYAFATVPTVNCKHGVGQAPYMAAEWVGMDGFGNLAPGPHNGLEQAGILEYCKNQGSTPEYYAFWEMVPGPIQLFGKVKPGDEVDMAVIGPDDNPYPGNFQLTVVDGDTYYVKWTTPPAGTIGYQHTAEVVTERPAWDGHLSGLIDTGKVTYTGATYSLSSGYQLAITQHPVWNLRIMPSRPWTSGLFTGCGPFSCVKNDAFSTSIGTWQFYFG
jgi:Peptidase A4 family